ncbi:dihydroxyacetone kinase subunit DhaL [Neobacillus niacini]|uniref:dihydroxyacetone kinase subunit DhaL n=1 Tax=Neobacillus niacini TaxID=86668 RepID=UPI003983B687
MEMKTLLNSLTIQQTKEMLIYVGEEVMNNKPLLTEVDSAIGDGDHGIGMHVGFSNANKKLTVENYSDINGIFKEIGKAMINNMGGASGVIFGTMFSGGVRKMDSFDSLNLELLTTIFTNGLKGVKERGKADLGDKTMIDALEPAVVSLQASLDQGRNLLDALKQAEASAAAGVENTKNYVAKFGRAKTMGERAIGFQDAGATTVWIIFKSMVQWVEKAESDKNE